MAGEPLLELRDISKSFGGTAALRGINLEVQRGAFHALVGENGAGKSTIVKIIAGIHRASTGSLHWEGTEVPAPAPTTVRSLGIGIVHQDSSVLPDLSVELNFALGQEPTRGMGWLNRGVVREVLAARSARFDLHLDPRRLGRQLSTGDRKILELLKVLDDDQKLLVLDEPTASLTAEETRHLLGMLEELKASGVAILYVTHRLEEIEGIVDRVTVLRDGANMGTLERHEASKSRVVSLMVGRDLGEIYPAPSAHLIDDVLFEANGISATGAFANVSFRVRRREIVAFVGLAGHGSFDAARAVVGLVPVDAGTTVMAGRERDIRTFGEALGAGMGFLGEDRADNVLAVRSVRENLALAALGRWSHLGVVDARRESAESRGLINLLAIRCQSQDAEMISLSGGNQQKVALGRWLAAKTSLLVLLDPTAGVDVGARAEIYKHLRAFADSGGGVLIATSDLAEAVGLADTIYAFYKGEQVAVFPRENRDQSIVLATITGHRGGVQ